jgi:phosphotransferase system enzyme I (PtsI)
MNYTGIPVSDGIAVGKIFCYVPYLPQKRQVRINKDGIEQALARFDKAKQQAGEELNAICAFLQSEPEKAKIFASHADILFDEAIDEDVRDLIHNELIDIEWALEKTFGKYINIIERVKDEMVRERTADMKDVYTRLIRNIDGIPENNLRVLPYPAVVAAHDLLPSDTAGINKSRVIGIVTELGGKTSHTAIIARSYGIPALVGIGDILAVLHDKMEVIVDAVDGSLICEPTGAEKRDYLVKKENFDRKMAQIAGFIGKKPITADGCEIEVQLNIGSADREELEGAKYTDGVGLFRSEFLYMNSDHLPTEDEQFAAYRKVLLQFGDRPVILRTLDIGGDKQLEALPLPAEQNPFLGNRALRFCFSRPDIFFSQLRAALRASVHGNLWLMFPMVGSMDDIYRVKEMVQKVKYELKNEGIPFDNETKLGIMIEIPSIALLADHAAFEVDFASIGTNDLCQYVTAADRLNPSVSSYCQNYHPALFRLIRHVCEQFNKYDKPLGVCGEMGGDPLSIPILIGLGIRKLSMNWSNVAYCKKTICSLTLKDARAVADTVCGMKTADEVENYLKGGSKSGQDVDPMQPFFP